jgi:hypothetical protein
VADKPNEHGRSCILSSSTHPVEANEEPLWLYAESRICISPTFWGHC